MSALLHHRAIRRHADQVWRFILSGGIGFILDLSSLRALVEFGRIDPHIAVVLSSLVGASFVFLANKFFTFKNRDQAVRNQLLKFVFVYAIAIGMNAIISNVLLFLGAYYLLAKIVAVGVGAVWNYALSHGFIFRRREDVDMLLS